MTTKLARWQNSTIVEMVLESLEEHHDQTPQDEYYLNIIEHVEDLLSLIESLDQRDLEQSVHNTRARLCTLISTFQALDMRIQHRARTALRMLDQTPYFQQLKLTQQQTEQHNKTHRKDNARQQRQRRREALQAKFSHQCPKCNAPMVACEHKTSQRTFWGCSRFGGRNMCRGTRKLTSTESAFMS